MYESAWNNVDKRKCWEGFVLGSGGSLVTDRGKLP